MLVDVLGQALIFQKALIFSWNSGYEGLVGPMLPEVDLVLQARG